MSYEMNKKANEIKESRELSVELQQQVERLNVVALEVDSLSAKIEELKLNTILIDSLSKITTRWSPIVEAFSDAYKEVGPFVFVKIETTDKDKMIVDLKMRSRDQVAKLERFIEQSMIHHIFTAEESRDFISVRVECTANKESESESEVGV